VTFEDRPQAPNPAARAELHARSFTAWPAWADLPLDVVHYGPDIPTEADLRLLGSLDGKRVLELGCGGGPIAVAMAKQGAKVIAVDESVDQIAHARNLAEREEVKVELRQGDLADLAFVRADTMDVAISVYSLGAVADPDRVFRQVHRVLRPEAPLVVSLPHPAYRAVDPAAEPPVLRRRYFDRTPITWWQDKESGTDFPLTISDLFSSLSRANFRVPTILEPEPPRAQVRGRHWTEAMRWVPSTLIVRARKLGI
jgi:2-polyprenyl-3-methyl-5-hydroxy-6-metoxy-1,4-benzoquinol methylase